MDMKALCYARWSSSEQRHGSTLQRQREITERFCAAKGWPIVDFQKDEGISAYTGANLTRGNLGKLTERLEREGGTGTVLVVEKLDRLSRQPPLVMMAWLQRFVDTGAMLATGDGRHLITKADLITNMMGILGIIFEAFVGYEESAKKSSRGLDNWRIKRESGKPLTNMCPAWLELAPDRSCYLAIEERATLVRRIFAMTESGIGKQVIASTLNREGVEPWGKGKRKGNGWHASYIQKILRNPAVIGEAQHGRKQRKDERRTLVGDVIRDYYPPVIDVATFERVNDAKRSRITAHQGRGRVLANIFSGIAECEECGGTMTMRAKGPAKRAGGRTVREDYLVCDNALRLRGCSNRVHFNYPALQGAVLDRLLTDALDDQHFAQPDHVGAVELEVATLRRDVTDNERRTNSQLDRIEANEAAGLDDHAGNTRYRTLLADGMKLRKALEDAEARLVVVRGAVSPAEHIIRVNEVRALMDSDDDDLRFKARTSVKLALRDLIGRMVMDGGAGMTNIELVASRRYIAFDRAGVLCADMDLQGREPVTVEETATLEGYDRRRVA